MTEPYVKELIIQEKTDEERRTELILSIIRTKQDLEISNKNFEYAEGDLVDYYTYQIKANRSKLDYLLKLAKKNGIVVDRIDELEIRLNEAI